jgi:hypothetical protein
MRRRYNNQSKRKRPQQRIIQLAFNFFIPGDSSIKHLPDEEIMIRILRTSNPKERAKSSLLCLPEKLFQIVHDGLLNEYFKERRRNGK